MITMAVRYRRNKLNTFFLCLIGVGLMQTIGLNKRMIMEAITQDDDPWSSFYAPVVAESCLPTFLQPFTSTLRRSDFVELDHCHLHSLNWTKFRSWADSIVESNLSKLTIAKVNNASLQVSDLKEEWTMELLEMYATHSGLCHFEDYHPRIQRKASIQAAGLKLQTVVKNTPVPPKQTRIVFSIVAYKDSTHLRRLIEAIHLPHHLIIIHLEQIQSDDSYISQVEAIAADYSNVVVVQFGTVIYKTDSISRVTLQLMSWVVKELKLEFDYFVALGGAVYPLFGALELSQHLYVSQENVWLGEATLKGGRVQSSQSHLLWKHRLLTTSTKIAVRAGALFQDAVPDWMDRALQHKSNSGNQAMFSFSTIERMLNSKKVLHIFALAKYSCCCCVEGKSHCLLAEKSFPLVVFTKYHYVCFHPSRTHMDWCYACYWSVGGSKKKHKHVPAMGRSRQSMHRKYEQRNLGFERDSMLSKRKPEPRGYYVFLGQFDLGSCYARKTTGNHVCKKVQLEPSWFCPIARKNTKRATCPFLDSREWLAIF
jgi:hypothetical protein